MTALPAGAALTDLGPVRGVASHRPAVTVFRGIPYAAPPAGDLRWRPPRPARPWDGVRVCDAFGDACPQNQADTLPPMSEDCLSVNVWTADLDPGAGRPVLVWIYGGRFVSGHGGDPRYDGAALAERGLVVVTFNYRTGVFGFLATPELSAESGHGGSGNYGLLDQLAALDWVRRNIEQFGGDPAKVTIAGQSAGAACVMDLVYSPLALGLFRGAIAESGALHPGDPALAHLAGSYRTLDAAHAEGEAYLREHGAATLAELRALPVPALLVGNDADERGAAAHRPPLFRPVLDGWVFPRSYHEALASGEHSDVPVVTGSNLDEDGAAPRRSVTVAQFREHALATYGAMAEEFCALYPATTDAEASAQSNAAARDHSRASTFLWAGRWSEAARSPVWTYQWTHAPPGPDAEVRGAFHGSEITYFLDNLDVNDRPWTERDVRIARMMGDYVANFVTTQDPNGDGLPRWPRHLAQTPVTMRLGDGFGPMAVADPARLDFFRRFLAARRPAR